MNYEEAKQRSDYKFSVNIPEYLLAELKADWLNSFCENGDPERGAAVLEIGYVDIELNIFAENQVARMSDSENHRPVLNYFCCIKHGDKDDRKYDNAYQRFLSFVKCYERNGVASENDHDILLISEDEISNFSDLLRDGDCVWIVESVDA